MAKKKVFMSTGYVVDSDLHIDLKPMSKFNIDELIYVDDIVKDKAGKVQKVRKVAYRKSADRVADYKVADFSIENLQAIGADNMLKYTVLSGDVDVSLRGIEGLMDAIDSIDAASSTEEVSE